MFFCFILLIASLATFLHSFHVSSCDPNCADKPVFKPSRLVVKYGDPASARCSVCRHACSETGLEVTAGKKRQDGTLIFWDVDSVTDWDTRATCFYTGDDSQRCCSELSLTVYKPPDRVAFSIDSEFSRPGLMVENKWYTLRCTVHKVAPFENLIVNFYRGQTRLHQWHTSNTTKTQITEIFLFDITPTREHDRAQYWCEAILDLGAEGPQPPPVMRSQSVTGEILYEMMDGGTLLNSFSVCFMLLSSALVLSEFPG